MNKKPRKKRYVLQAKVSYIRNVAVYDYNVESAKDQVIKALKSGLLKMQTMGKKKYEAISKTDYSLKEAGETIHEMPLSREK